MYRYPFDRVVRTPGHEKARFPAIVKLHEYG
jgi:hypothetical protein